MAVFGNYIAESAIEESVLPDVDAESLMMDESVEPCHEDNFLVAGARICAESTENMNRIMQACAIQEFCYFEENGTEMVYTEAAVTGFIEKAKAFFMNLWKKIQGIFKKAIMMFSSKSKTDKEFLNKYKKEITAAQNSSFGDTEVDIYDYVFYRNPGDFTRYKGCTTGDSGFQAIGNCQGACVDWIVTNSPAKSIKTNLANLYKTDSKDDNATKAAVDKVDDDLKLVAESDWKEDYKDHTRGNMVKQIDSSAPADISASEFTKEIAEACQGDSSKDSVSLSTALRKAAKFLEDSKDITKGLDDWLKAWKKDIDTEIKNLNQVARDLNKATCKEASNENRVKEAHHTIVTACINMDKDLRTIGITFHSAVINQIKACSGQSKAICVKAVHYKKPKNESYAYTEESTGSLLDSIELI